MPQPKRDVQRDKRLTVFLTEDDHDLLSKVASYCGLKSPGALATYMLESHLAHSFNPIMAMKTATVVQDRLFKAKWPSEWSLSPILDKAPLLPEADMDADQLEKLRGEILEEIKEKKLREKNEGKK